VVSRNSSAGIVMDCGLDGQGLISGRGKRFLHSVQCPIQRVPGALSPEVKRPGRDHSPPSSAEVKNDGAIPPLPHTFSSRGV
jgi:hypothetical protein